MMFSNSQYLNGKFKIKKSNTKNRDKRSEYLVLISMTLKIAFMVILSYFLNHKAQKGIYEKNNSSHGMRFISICWLQYSG